MIRRRYLNVMMEFVNVIKNFITFKYNNDDKEINKDSECNKDVKNYESYDYEKRIKKSEDWDFKSISRISEELNNGKLIKNEICINEDDFKTSYQPGSKTSKMFNYQTNSKIFPGNLNLPSMSCLWQKIEDWLNETYPELYDELNDGATIDELNSFEDELGGLLMPMEFREFYKHHDGQTRSQRSAGLFFGMTFLNLETILGEHKIWINVLSRLDFIKNIADKKTDTEKGSSSFVHKFKKIFSNQKSFPENVIKKCYFNKKWVPFLKDNMGNQLAIDLDPDYKGVNGQIIAFGRDFDTKVLIASSYKEFIGIFVNDLEKGNFNIDNTNSINEMKSSFCYDFGQQFVGDEDENQGDLLFHSNDPQEFFENISSSFSSYIEVMEVRSKNKKNT